MLINDQASILLNLTFFHFKITKNFSIFKGYDFINLNLF